MTRKFAALAGVIALAGCMAQRTPPQPQPTQPVRQAPPPVRLPPPPPPRTDWRDLPLTPGLWVYRGLGNGSEAAFGQAGAAAFTVRCDRGNRRITLSRGGAAAGAMTIRTSTIARNLPVSAGAAALDPRDPLLDAMAFSRGRFTVEAAGTAMLVIPSWPEPARVVEDCR